MLFLNTMIQSIYSVTDYTFELGPIALVRDADKMPFWYDAEFGRLRRNETEFDFWTTNEAGKPPQWKMHGILEDPMQTVDWPKEHLELTDNDTLMLDKAWRVIPNKTSEYVVGRFMIESSFFANLNNTNCRMSLWLDCISCIVDMHVLVSQPAYCFYENVNDKDAERQCQDNLKRLYDIIREYEVKNGKLPDAAFFPENPFDDADSLAVILGKESHQYFACPSSSPDFKKLGFNYIWNEKLNGKKLSEITDSANTWLMMDFVGIHRWMVEVKSCGHLGKVNILYADGTVKSGIPMSLDEWADWAKKY